jgi:hypothetical protein
MTDKYNTIVVVLDKDIREDDAENLINAIQLLKGVIAIGGNVTDIDTYAVERRVKLELFNKLVEQLK